MHRIRSDEDVLDLLDTLYPSAYPTDRWDRLYADRDRDVPFFVDLPDESLVAWTADGSPGRALDLGCGPGRNAVHLATAGWDVDAVDLSRTAIAWGRERAAAAGVAVRFVVGDAFAPDVLEGPYDLVVDSGCFHHLPPHRRVSHLALLRRVLRPDGLVALTCFSTDPDAGAADLADVELFRSGRLHGGIGYTEADLRWIFAEYEMAQLRRMVAPPATAPVFGRAFLWAVLLSRP